HLYRSRHRVRLLLLARSDGEWRTGSFQAVPDVRDLLEEAPVIPLGPLIPASKPAQDQQGAFQQAVGKPAQDRGSAFKQAAGDLARLLSEVPTLPTHDWKSLAGTLRPPADLSHPRYDNVLTLQMTALVTLLQHGPRPADTPAGTPPERTLLKHEERFWEASAKTPAYKLDLPVPTLGAAVATATLCGAGTPDEALRVITALPGLPDHQQASTTAWLASLYPGGPNRYWGSLQPDRIAEYHASHVLAEGRIPLPALLNEASPGQQAQLITVLARAAIAHYNAGRTVDSDRILHTLHAALDRASLAYPAVRTAAAALPEASRIIGPLASRLIATIARADRELAADNPAVYEPHLANSLSNLSIHLSRAGRHAEAVTTAEEAVEIYRRLAADIPAAYEALFAGSLHTLSIRFSEAGLHAEALTAAEEAVEILRRLVAGDPAAHEADLAHSLSHLGAQLSEAGRQDEGLTAAEEAVEILRRLVAGNPAAHEPRLAGSLSNLGLHLSQAGLHAEALTAAEEAVEILRRLVAGNPAAHEPDLAKSLPHLGLHLSQAGRHAEALTTVGEAVEIYQRLAADIPTAFEPSLAGSLDSLSNRLSEVGRQAEALTAAEQAVEIYRQLAVTNPAPYGPSLANSLRNLSIRLSKAGRRTEAVTAAMEAVGIYSLACRTPQPLPTHTDQPPWNAGGPRHPAAGNPATHEPDLADSLLSLSIRLAEADQRTKALTAAEKAVEIFRRLAASEPAAHEPGLARSLSHLGTQLYHAGRRTEALTAIEEAVKIRRRLVTGNPAMHEPGLAVSLHDLSIQLSTAGRRTEALTAIEEAVKIQRRHLTGNPATHELALADSLYVSAVLLGAGGDFSRALLATEEAAEIYSDHVATAPPVLQRLGTVLGLQAQLFDVLGRRKEARKVRRWAAANLPPADSHN
ncbi:tetratricopeptide repeat protein, partial [Streptomyces sp. PSKA30]|uniref:tetratricopeptide repeat protein n=1 Tax=Streptomyces sp. PSKA30 TaxID=2874597 RepID=UPI001CD134C3